MANISIQNTIKLLLVLFLIILAGCDAKNIDGTEVKSNSKLFTEVARSLQEPCNNPAEFGRCGCYLDGIKTSCSIVNRCVENGFCVVVTRKP